MSLFAHQQKIVDDDPKRCGLFLGTSGGKTMLGLTLARGSLLVIATKSVVEDGNWQRERERIGRTDLPMTVISKETFRRDWQDLPRYATVVGDEGHNLLGATPVTVQRKRMRYPKVSQLFEATAGYLAKHRPDRFYIATATPDRSPMAIWAAARLLGRDWDFYKFRDWFYEQVRIGKHDVWLPKKDAKTKAELGVLIRKLGYVGRLEDWFDVPEQTHRTDYVDLTAEQLAEVRKLKLEYPDPLRLAGKEDQVENGVLIGDEYVPTKVFKSGKIDRLLDYAAEFPQLLVFAKYTDQINAIVAALRDEGYKVLTLTGATPDKGAVIAEANRGPCVVVAQSTISEGYGLPEFKCTVFVSLSGSLVNYIQALGRTLRTPKLEAKLYVYLVCRDEPDVTLPNGKEKKGHRSRDKKRYKANVIDKVDYHEEMYEKN